MKSIPQLIVLLSLLAAVGAYAQNPPARKPEMHWTELPAIPDPEGFAATFAGVSHGALIVAGGANITGDKWAEPLTKKWYDTAFVLEQFNGEWKSGFKLPRPLAYGVSITADDAVLCFGGSNATGHYADAFRLEWDGGILRTTPLPPLPRPCANACGALVGRTIYLAGGLEHPTDTQALHTFWALYLDAPNPVWTELEPWPGSERMLAVAGALEDSFFLCSGAKLTPGPEGKPVREYLRDAYRFTPGSGWTQLADLPRAAVAAPSPAPAVLGGAGLLICTGDDGLNVDFQPIAKHPGFPRNALLYSPLENAWSVIEGLPFSLATAPVVVWGDLIVIPNGELRPRVRTPKVWAHLPRLTEDDSPKR